MVLSIRQYLRTVECCHPCLGSNFIPIDSKKKKIWNFTIRLGIIARSHDRHFYCESDESDEGHISSEMI